MLNLFKKLVSDPRPDNLQNEVNPNEVAVMTLQKAKQNKIVEEIHESFFTEVDKLLAEARIMKPKETDQQALIDKANRLRKLGFRNTIESLTAREEEYRLAKIQHENKEKQNLIDAITYFSVKYPNYKFITEESVKKICQKYGLIYGEVSKYIGKVPDNNLKHIEDFKVDKQDAITVITFERWKYVAYVPFNWDKKKWRIYNKRIIS